MPLRVLSYKDRIFATREEAGDELARQLEQYRAQKPLILGIPRGGIIIARQAAHWLTAELDILLSRKLGAPDTPELAIGAITENDKLFLNTTLIEELNIPKEFIEDEQKRQRKEIRRRAAVYRAVRPRISLKGRTVIVTDDGAATGATMQAALWGCREELPARLVCAFPSGSDQAVTRLAQDCDLLIALSVPPFFAAVSQSYASFPQISDEEVLEILRDENDAMGATGRQNRAERGVQP